MKLFSKGVSLLLTSLALIGLRTAAQGQTHLKPTSGNTVTPRITQIQIPTLPINKLPREAQVTIALIRKGGPYPYQQDGTIFRNRERKLPSAPVGYYREYTVTTPALQIEAHDVLLLARVTKFIILATIIEAL
jgi:guanyl-specific ribonuclease Sa